MFEDHKSWTRASEHLFRNSKIICSTNDAMKLDMNNTIGAFKNSARMSNKIHYKDISIAIPRHV